MAKKVDSSAAKAPPKKAQSTKGGCKEISSLFDARKKEKKEQRREAAEISKRNEKRRQPPQQRCSLNGSEWVDDGLGGKYNSEGFTGRVEDGVKVFKAHILRKPNAGQTDQCPFDCDCCYI